MIKERPIATRGIKADRVLVILGFLSALAAGPFGIMIGYFILKHTEKDDSGKEYYYYDTDSRKAGLVMLVIGVVQFILVIVGSLLRNVVFA